MRITIAAIGRMKAGPERDLAQRYLDQFNQTGGRLGLSLAVREIVESRAGSATARKDQEAAALLAALPAPVTLIVLDEAGKNTRQPSLCCPSG